MRHLVITLSFAGIVVACDKKEPTPATVGEANPSAAATATPGKTTPTPAVNKPTPTPPAAAANKPTTTAATPAKADNGNAVGTKVGQQAPDFTLTDTEGKTVKLSSFVGKTVVLEWYNPDCPFVKYAYTDGPLKGMAKKFASDKLVWLNINSSAPGKQGHGVERNKKAFKDNGLSRAVLVDEDGKVGRLYKAKTTPQMFVINPKGAIVYTGAIDNAPFGNVKGGGDVINYVEQALGKLAGSKAIVTSETKPYGCSVKYR